MNFFSKISKGFKVLTGVLTVATGSISVFTFYNSNNDTLCMSINGESLEKEDSRDFVVFIENSQCENKLHSLYPTFSNSSNHSIKNFDLRYHVLKSSILFEPSDYYSLHRNPDESFTLKYNDDVLNNRIVENPIYKVIIPKEGGDLTLVADATFDGCKKSYNCTVTSHYNVVPNNDSLSFEDWEKQCLESYDISGTNGIFFIDKDGHFSFIEPVELVAYSSDRNRYVGAETDDDTPVSVKDISLGNGSYSVRQYSDSKMGDPKNHIDFEFSSILSDTIILAALLFEDTENKLSLDLLGGRLSSSESSLSRTYDVAHQIKDYALCKDNMSLLDSLHIHRGFKYYRIKNRSHYTIAVYIPTSMGNYEFQLIAPHRSYYAPLGTMENRIRCFEVPETVLCKGYFPYFKSFDYYNTKISDVTINNDIFDSIFGAIFFLLILFNIFALIPAFNSFEDLASKLSMTFFGMLFLLVFVESLICAIFALPFYITLL